MWNLYSRHPINVRLWFFLSPSRFQILTISKIWTSCPFCYDNLFSALDFLITLFSLFFSGAMSSRYWTSISSHFCLIVSSLFLSDFHRLSPSGSPFHMTSFSRSWKIRTNASLMESTSPFLILFDPFWTRHFSDNWSPLFYHSLSCPFLQCFCIFIGICYIHIHWVCFVICLLHFHFCLLWDEGNQAI